MLPAQAERQAESSAHEGEPVNCSPGKAPHAESVAVRCCSSAQPASCAQAAVPVGAGSNTPIRLAELPTAECACEQGTQVAEQATPASGQAEGEQHWAEDGGISGLSEMLVPSAALSAGLQGRDQEVSGIPLLQESSGVAKTSAELDGSSLITCEPESTAEKASFKVAAETASERSSLLQEG